MGYLRTVLRMRQRDVGPAVGSYLGGAAAARIGDETAGPALLLAGLAATGSAAHAALVPAALMASAAVGGPLFGAVLDRSARPGRLLAAALAGYAAALTLLLAALPRLPLALTVLLAALAGPLAPALSAAWSAQLPHLPGPPGPEGAQRPARVTAFDAMTYDVAGLAGPALAGAVAGWSGAGAAVVAAAVLVGLAVPSAWTLPRAAPDRREVPAGLRRELAAGFRAIGASGVLGRATAASVVSCVGAGMFVTCAPVAGAAALGGAGHGAYLLSGAAVASLVANGLLARRPSAVRPETVLRCATAVLGAAFLLAATVRPPVLALAAVLAGAAEGPQLTALFAIRHREVPPRLRGQVFTTGAGLKTAGYALGTALAGLLAARSLPAALLTAAAFQALALLALTPRPRRPRGADASPDRSASAPLRRGLR